MDQQNKKEVRCPICKALLFKKEESKGKVEIKCRNCKKIVEIRLS